MPHTDLRRRSVDAPSIQAREVFPSGLALHPTLDIYRDNVHPLPSVDTQIEEV
jgi:hypothetical protein